MAAGGTRRSNGKASLGRRGDGAGVAALQGQFHRGRAPPRSSSTSSPSASWACRERRTTCRSFSPTIRPCSPTARGRSWPSAAASAICGVSRRNDPTGFSRELWGAFGEMGFAGVLVPEAEGGSGLGHVEAGIILEEIGRSLTPSPFLTTAVGRSPRSSRRAGRAAGAFSRPSPKASSSAALAIDETAHRLDRSASR